MAVHCAWAVRKGWLTAACCTWLLAGGMGTPLALAQAPADPPTIEQWSGHRKVTPDAGEAPVPAVRVPVEPGLLDLTPKPTSRVTEVERPGKAVAPNQRQLLGKWGQQVLRSTGKLAQECGSAVQTCAGSVSSSSSRLVETLGGGKSRPEANVRVEVALQPVTPVAHVETPREMAPVVAEAAQPMEEGMPWYKVVWLQIAVAGGTVVAGPLILVLALGIMLRRYGPLLRVEVTNPGVLRLEGGMLHAAVPATEYTQAVDTQAMENFTGEYFDLGPSYDEERKAKEEAQRHAEMAVLQEIFEQNVRLHEEIRAAQSPVISSEHPASQPQVAETTVTAADPLAMALEQYAAMWPDEKLDR